MGKAYKKKNILLYIYRIIIIIIVQLFKKYRNKKFFLCMNIKIFWDLIF